MGCAHGGSTGVGCDLEVGTVGGVVGHGGSIGQAPSGGSRGTSGGGEVGDERLRVTVTSVTRAGCGCVSMMCRSGLNVGYVLFSRGLQSVKVCALET